MVPVSSKCLCAGVKARGEQCSWGWGIPVIHIPLLAPLSLFHWCLPSFGALQSTCTPKQRSLPSPGVRTWGTPGSHQKSPRVFPEHPLVLSNKCHRCRRCQVSAGCSLSELAVLIPDRNQAGATGNEAKQHTGR